MKKLLATIISISMLAASAAVPVMADELPEENTFSDELAEEIIEATEDEELEGYAELNTYAASDYDIEDVNLTFEDGTVDNGIDGTKAKQIGDTFERIFSTSIDSTYEFYLGFDFCFDNESGDIEVPQFKSNGSVDKVGPIITFDGTNLRTQTGGSSYQQLGAIVLNEWYRGEIEGRTGMGASYTTFRLYNKAGELVQETPNFNMRNLSSNNRSFNGMQAKDVSLDNVLLVQEKPDTITLSSTAEEMDAGSDIALDYVMTRQDKEFNKYAVTWSVYNAADTAPLEDENIIITSGGVLSAGIKSETQTVTVRATAVFGDKELYGSKQIKINAVDTGSEKFDQITVSGPDAVKAGESNVYSFTATKDGADVTSTLDASDITWSIYNNLGILKNNNIYINIENGTLTIDDSVIPQTINVRASSASGAIYGQIPVSITWSDKQKEIVLSYDACETEMTGTTPVDSWDGSKAYATNDNVTFAFGDQTVYAMTDVDIKFDTTDGHGLTLFNNNGSENSNIRVHGGGLGQQTGGSNWTTILTESEFDAEAWYHIEFLYLNDHTSGYNVYKIGEDGTKELVKTMPNCNKRNNKPYGKITFTQGLNIDNFKVVQAAADGLTLTSPGQFVFAGDTAQFGATATRSGLTMDGTSGISWSVLDADMLPIIDGSISVSDLGLLTVDSQAKAQDVTVRVSSTTGAYADSKITIQVAEIFNITNVGINEEGTKIVKIYADKNFYYNDDVVFIVAIKDQWGRLKAIKTVSTFGDSLSLGANEIAAELELPSDFDKDQDQIEGMVWTRLAD